MVVDEEIVKVKIECGNTMFWLELITEKYQFNRSSDQKKTRRDSLIHFYFIRPLRMLRPTIVDSALL